MLIKFKHGKFISYNVKYSCVRTYKFIIDSFILKFSTFCIVVSFVGRNISLVIPHKLISFGRIEKIKCFNIYFIKISNTYLGTGNCS